jgi:hypothetical protein
MRKGHATPELRTLTVIVEDYRARYGPRCDDEIAWLRTRPTLREAIRAAAMCERRDGKRLDHQRRIPYEVLSRSERVLQRMRREIRRSGSFERLHELVADAIGDIVGIGELTVYDVSVRVAAFLRLRPRYVYLHAGTRKGAKALGFTGREARLSRRDLPQPLQTLSAAALEDLLCIYKRELGRLRSSTG